MNTKQRKRYKKHIRQVQKKRRKHLLTEDVLYKQGMIGEVEWRTSKRLFNKHFEGRFRFTDSYVEEMGIEHLMNNWTRCWGIVQKKETECEEEC